MIYIEKPRTVEAMQYDGSQESANEIEQWLKTKLGPEFDFTMLGMPENYYVVLAGGISILSETDFLARFEAVA